MTILINLLERGKNMEGLTRTHHFMMILKESDLLRREIERKLTPETAAEYNKITAVRNSAFVELLKSNMPYTDTGKVIRITIDDENFDISKKSLHRFVGEDNFNLLLEDKENPVESKAPEISSIESGDFNFRNMQLKKDESVADSIARLEKESQGEMQQIPSIDEIKNTVQKSMHDAMGDLMKSVLSELASAQQTGNIMNENNTPDAQELAPQDSTLKDVTPCTHTVTSLDSDSICDSVNKSANESVNESANKCVNESVKECDTLCDTPATASANTEIAESITETGNNKQIDAENNEQAIAQDNNIDSKSIEPETTLEDVTQPAAPNDETHNIIVEMPNEERAVENIIPANDKETKTEEVVDKKDITPSQNAAEASVPFETGSNAPVPEGDMEIMFSSDTIPNSKETTQIADHDETLSDVNDEIEAMPIEQQPQPALNTESIPKNDAIAVAPKPIDESDAENAKEEISTTTLYTGAPTSVPEAKEEMVTDTSSNEKDIETAAQNIPENSQSVPVMDEHVTDKEEISEEEDDSLVKDDGEINYEDNTQDDNDNEDVTENSEEPVQIAPGESQQPIEAAEDNGLIVEEIDIGEHHIYEEDTEVTEATEQNNNDSVEVIGSSSSVEEVEPSKAEIFQNKQSLDFENEDVTYIRSEDVTMSRHAIVYVENTEAARKVPLYAPAEIIIMPLTSARKTNIPRVAIYIKSQGNISVCVPDIDDMGCMHVVFDKYDLKIKSEYTADGSFTSDISIPAYLTKGMEGLLQKKQLQNGWGHIVYRDNPNNLHIFPIKSEGEDNEFADFIYVLENKGTGECEAKIARNTVPTFKNNDVTYQIFCKWKDDVIFSKLERI